MPSSTVAGGNRRWTLLRLAVAIAVLLCLASASLAQDDAPPSEPQRPFDRRFAPSRGGRSTVVEPQRYTPGGELNQTTSPPRFTPGRGPGSGAFDRAGPFESRGPFGRDPGSPPPMESEPIETGFVFLDGQYVPPPYVVRVAEGELSINGQPVRATFTGGQQGERGWGPRDNRFSRVTNELASGYVLVAFADEALILLNDLLTTRDCLSVFTAGEERSEEVEALAASLPSQVDGDRLIGWLKEFTPPPDLVERAKTNIAMYDKVEASNRESIAAVRRIDRFTYPLTVLGMLLAVFAVGHVLIARPTSGASDNAAADVSPPAMRSVVISISLIVALSGLDLVWTLLAWQAGQMRELNPLGSRLIQDPQALIAFKITLTLLAAGLLFALRRHRSAQYGAWWLCLLLTILAFRWLTFNSLFVS